MKIFIVLPIVTAMVFTMAACGGSGSPNRTGVSNASNNIVSDDTGSAEEIGPAGEETIEWVDEGPAWGSIPEIVYLVDIRNDDSIIQIPQLEWEIEPPAAGLAFNKQILDFAEGYEEYVDGHPEGYFCEIKAYGTQIGTVFQILMTKAFYPSYGSYGEAAAFFYDCFEQEIINEWDSDTDIKAVEAEMKAGAYLDEGLSVVSVKYISTVLDLRDETMLYEVTAKSDDGDPWVYLYAYNTGEGIIMDGETFLFKFGEFIEDLNAIYATP